MTQTPSNTQSWPRGSISNTALQVAPTVTHNISVVTRQLSESSSVPLPPNPSSNPVITGGTSSSRTSTMSSKMTTSPSSSVMAAANDYNSTLTPTRVLTSLYRSEIVSLVPLRLLNSSTSPTVRQTSVYVASSTAPQERSSLTIRPVEPTKTHSIIMPIPVSASTKEQTMATSYTSSVLTEKTSNFEVTSTYPTSISTANMSTRALELTTTPNTTQGHTISNNHTRLSTTSSSTTNTGTGSNDTQQTRVTALPLFYIIIITSVSTTILLGTLSLCVYLICLRRRNKRKRKRQALERRKSYRETLYDLGRTTSSGSSHSSTDGSHQLSIRNSTEVVLRHNSRRTPSDSLDRRNSRLSLLWRKGSSLTGANTPTMNCSTFKPNQQLYLPHIQVEVHVNGDLNNYTAESRVGSFCKPDDVEANTLAFTAPSPSTNSENSIIDKMLHTR